MGIKTYIFANIILFLEILIQLKTLKSKVTEKKSIIGTPYIIVFIILIFNLYMALVLILDYFKTGSTDLNLLLKTFTHIQVLTALILNFKTSSRIKK